MALSILISDPEESWANEIKAFLERRSFIVQMALNGKDCQLKMYKSKFFAVVLDISTKDHSGIEVLRYLRLSAPSVKIILTAHEERLKALELSQDELSKLGASHILIKPYSLTVLRDSIEGVNQIDPLKKKEGTPKVEREEVEFDADDSEFTGIKLEDFYSGNTAIFDCYIRSAPNRYVKVAHKGDFFEHSKIDKLIKQQKAEYLYFKTEERAIYINFINKILEKMISLNKGESKEKIRTVKNLAEKYIEETYTEGLKPQLIEEGKKICQNMFDLVQKNPGLSSLVATYEDGEPDAYTHLFLSSFMSVILCKNLEWSSSKIIELVAFGALLHDIGMLKLSTEVRNLDVSEMDSEQLEQFKQHPKLGAELLQKYPLVTEPVRQIVYQHHEYVNGSGFPEGLTGIKIYPLAKVVSLGNEFSNFLVEKRISPLQGLSLFISDRDNITKFDPVLTKVLVKGFVRDP